MPRPVAIVGGGISGLTAGYWLMRAGIDITIFESSSAVGGNVRSEKLDGFLIELGAHSTLASAELLRLIDELGITDQIAQPRAAAKRRFIIKHGKLTQLPTSIVGFATSSAFSAGAKLRLLREPFIARGSHESESIADFFARRFGREIVDFAVDPFISGIYAGDPGKLSVRHAFPRLYEMEQADGSILRGMLLGRTPEHEKMDKGTPRSITFEQGMQTMIDALSKQLGAAISLNSPVSAITSSADGQFEVTTAAGSAEFDAVVLSVPAYAAAPLLNKMAPDLSDILENIDHAPVATVYTAFKKTDVAVDPNGFGFLVPSRERRRILGSLWTSSAFENRAPDDYHLFTTFIGGSRDRPPALLPPEELIAIAVTELDSVLGISGEPTFTYVKQWSKAIPQYNIGYDDVTDAVELFRLKHSRAFVCSNYYRGISVSDCVKNARAVAAEVEQALSTP